MFGIGKSIAMAQVSTSPTVLSSVPHSSSNSLPLLPLRSRRKIAPINAASSSGDAGGPASEKGNPLAVVLDVPRTIWKRTLRPLSDFGFGHRSIWEGGVGLFLVSGAVVLALSLAWLRGFQLRHKFRKYLAVFEFSQACGIANGTPVRIRGVTVGNVVRVIPSLKNIEAVVEVLFIRLKVRLSTLFDFGYVKMYNFSFQVEDDKIVIPRNSLIEVNQSGLLMETIIDITPRDPIPNASVGPLDPECVKEGLIVCDRQKVKGKQGVSLDALVGIFTRLGRDVEAIGIANTYSLAQQVASVIGDAKPLLAKV